MRIENRSLVPLVYRQVTQEQMEQTVRGVDPGADAVLLSRHSSLLLRPTCSAPFAADEPLLATLIGVNVLGASCESGVLLRVLCTRVQVHFTTTRT